MNKLKNFIEFLRKEITNDDTRLDFQFGVCFVIFALVSFVMTFVNLITDFRELMYATLIFAFLNVINFILVATKKHSRLSRYLFAIEITVLFTFFIVNGEPQGFSAIWTALLPTCGMLLYRRKWGSILSVIQLFIIIFFFWTPVGRGMLNWTYEEQFMVRLPLLYTAFYVIGLFFETVRSMTMDELTDARDKYRKQSLICPLTGLKNSLSYSIDIASIETEYIKKGTDYTILSMDVNGLKNVNDEYGHLAGDQLLREAANLLREIFKDNEYLYHAGGDEFYCIVKNASLKDSDFKDISDKLKCSKFIYDGNEIILSIAIGYSRHSNNRSYEDAFKLADKMMYENKKNIKDELNIKGR